MKKSINAWSFDNTLGFEDVFSMAKRAGYECIEFNLDPEGAHSFTFDSNEETFKTVRALIEKYGIEVKSVSTGLYWSSGAFGSDNPEKRDEALKIIRKQLECASAIGAETILVVTCIDEETGYYKSFENTINVFRSLEKEIKDAGVCVGIENVWNRFFLSPFDAKYVIEKIDNPMVGLYFDIGNMVEFSEPQYWIETVGKYIKKVHIKDFKRNNDRTNSGGIFCGLLEGHVDFEKTIPMLKAAGYDGPLTAEIFNSKGLETEAFINEVYQGVEKIVAMAK